MLSKLSSRSGTKELSLCHKLWFSKTNIVAIWFSRPSIFQTMNSVRHYKLSLKYQRFAESDWKDKGIRKFELVEKIYWDSEKTAKDLFNLKPLYFFFDLFILTLTRLSGLHPSQYL